jgi:hypothetical protein
MKVYILDTNFEKIDILDEYISLIWSERYNKFGDFELYVPLNLQTYLTFRPDYYLELENSKTSMVIETLNIKTDKDSGDLLTVTGRSLESILDRRIIWGQKVLFGDFQDGINELLCDAIIEPSEPTRTIPNFVFVGSTDTNITNLTIDAQVSTENLYSVVQKLCEINDLGFELSFKKPNGFNFRLYSGIDRSYDQIALPRVIFSNEFDNLFSSEKIQNKIPFKTVSLVLGAGDGADRAGAVAQIPSGAGSGLTRREMYTDGSDVDEEVEGVIVSPEDYAIQLINKGNIALSENSQIEYFEGQIDTNGRFIYGRDFNLGDIVQIENNIGGSGRARITEIIRSQNSTGEYLYPKFSMIE